MRVLVRNKDGQNLMPCKPSKARKLLKADKAKIINRKPFAIQLKYGSSGYSQQTTLGVDTGAKHVGIAVALEDKIIAKGEIELRQDISSKITTRRSYRRGRRSRNTRYRQPRFDNRKKPQGWLPPSIESRVANTMNWVKRFQKFLPNNTLIVELGKFDPHQLINPDIEGKDYQMGQTAGYFDVRHFVFERDHYICQVCGETDKILNTHHIVYNGNGGTNRADNLITVCSDCHTYENHQPGGILYQWQQEGKQVPQYKAPTFMNIVRRRFYEYFGDNMTVVYGSYTKPKRKELGLEKTHYNDAVAITGVPVGFKDEFTSYFKVVQFRKKKRSLHEATARKGRKDPNRTQKRNAKNTKMISSKTHGEFYLNDRVKVDGEVGFISGFSGSSVYVKDIKGNYITMPDKNYKQVSLRKLEVLEHNNNWQFISHLRYA